MLKYILMTAVICCAAFGFEFFNKKENNLPQEKNSLSQKGEKNTMETATLAGGCFWCIETIFDDLKGVEKVESGYSGGKSTNPTYEEVSAGNTGHAEVVQITFDPSIISYEKLLEIFFHIHNPTTLHKQGADVGTQYRSAIFYTGEDERKLTEAFIDAVNKSKVFSSPVVTQVVPLKEFFDAEKYHQDYLFKNPNDPYIVINDKPKVDDLKKRFADLYVEKS